MPGPDKIFEVAFAVGFILATIIPRDVREVLVEIFEAARIPLEAKRKADQEMHL